MGIDILFHRFLCIFRDTIMKYDSEGDVYEQLSR